LHSQHPATFLIAPVLFEQRTHYRTYNAFKNSNVAVNCWTMEEGEMEIVIKEYIVFEVPAPVVWQTGF
jgi:hypothetical protein